MADIWTYESPLLSRRVRRASGRGSTTVCIFENIPADVSEGLIPADYSPLPTDKFPGVWLTNRGPVLMDVDFHKEWRMGPITGSSRWFSRMSLMYRCRTPDEWLEANPNHGLFLSSAGLILRNTRVSPGGTLLHGRDPSDLTGRTSRFIESGGRTHPDFRLAREVYAIVADMDGYYYPFETRVGKYNQSHLANFARGMQTFDNTGMWMLAHVSSVPRSNYRGLYLCRYTFLLDDNKYVVGGATYNGWQNPVISREWIFGHQQVDVKDASGNVIGTGVSGMFQPATRAAYKEHMISPASFFEVDGMLSNSW